MKIKISFSALFLLFLISCNNSKTTADDADTTKLDSIIAASSSSQIWIVDSKASTLTWQGTKPNTVHEGTIAIKEGTLSSENEKLTAGNFIIDMSSITETTNSDDPQSQNKLVTHLKSNDFFNVDTFPTSSFAITKVEENIVFGNLTIKNITREIKFPVDFKISGAILNASTGFAIDRTLWEINFNSGKKLKDKVANKIIGDNINYKLTLIAYKQ